MRSPCHLPNITQDISCSVIFPNSPQHWNMNKKQPQTITRFFFHLFPVPFPFPSHHPPEFFPRLWHPLARKKRSAQAAAGECFEARSFPWPEVAVWRFPRLELELQEEPAWGKAWDFRGNYEKCIIIYDYIYLWDTCRNLWKFIYGNL